MKLIYHECYRNYGDRLIMTHDMKWFVDNLEESCRKNFWVVEELEHFESSPVRKPKKKEEDEEESSEKEGKEEEKEEEADEVDPKRKDQFLWPIEDPEELYYSQWN